VSYGEHLGNDNDCTNCHGNTGANGELNNAANGNAGLHTLDSQSTCATCHTTYDTDYKAHDVQDHNGVVKTGVSGDWAGNPPLRTNCAGCHSDDVVNTTAAADTHNDNCQNCHSSATVGTLVDGGNNYGDARGHILGTTSSCYDCHNADGYFDTHTHSPHDVQHRDGTDQSAGSDCESCHNDAGANLNTWNDIYVEHLSNCGTCHDATRDVNPVAPTGITVFERIVTGSGDKVSPTGCLHCHADRSASHGGHDVPDQFIGGTTPCTSCHDSQANRNYVSDLHGRQWASTALTSNCEVCHVAPGGGGNLQDYSGGGVIIPGDTVNYEAAHNGPSTTLCYECHNDGGGAGPTLSQTDDFTGTTTGNAGRPTFGNWTGVNGSDGTNGWMAWSGATDTSGTGPSSGNPGNYVVLESSPTSGGTSSAITVISATDNAGGSGNMVIYATSPDASGTNQFYVDGTPMGTWNSGASRWEYTTGTGTATVTVTSDTNGTGTVATVVDKTPPTVCCTTAYDVTVNQAEYSAKNASKNQMDVSITANNGGTQWFVRWGTTDYAMTLDTGTTYIWSLVVGNTAAAYDDVYIYATDYPGGAGCAAVYSAVTDISGGAGPPSSWTSSTDPISCTDDPALDVITINSAGWNSDTDSLTVNATHVDASNLYVDYGAYVNNLKTSNPESFSTTENSNYVRLYSATGGEAWYPVTCSGSNCGGGGDSDVTNGVDVTSGSTQYLESNTIDTTSYDLSLTFTFDYNMNVNDNSDAVLYVDAWDGGAWNLAATVDTGDTGDTWASSGAIDVSTWGNASFKLRIRYLVGTGTTYQNDVAVDNLVIAGTGTAAPSTNYHPAYAHTIGTSVNCSSCHTGNIITGIHKASTGTVSNPGDFATKTECYKCHASSTAAVITAIYNGADGTAQNCANCHSGIDSDYSTHTADTHTDWLAAPADTTIQSDDCDDCHSGNIQNVVHNVSKTCDNCHTNNTNDATFRSGTNGDATGHVIGVTSDCLDCHTTTYFPSHTYDPSHTVGIWGDTSGGFTCSTSGCHDTESENWTNIKSRHNLANGAASVCLVCHDSTRSNATDAGTIDPAYTDDSVQGVILEASGNISCLDCHFDKSAVHGVHTEGDGTLGVVTVAPNDTPCGGCHAAASGSSAPKGEVTAGIHSDDCSMCHQGGVGGAAPPVGSSADNTNVYNSGWLSANKPHNCTECHTAYFGDNTDGHTHVHAMALTTNSTCETCHNADGSDGSDAGNANSAPFVATNDVHDASQCDTCHNITTGAMDGSLKGSAATGNPGGDSIYQCNECHTASWIAIHTASTNVDHATARVTTTGSNCTTAACHDSGGTGNARATSASPYVAAGDVHNTTAGGDGCLACHDGGGDGGFVTAVNADTITAGNCEGCHTSGASTWSSIHTGSTGVDHSTLVANLATCTSSCHTATGGAASIPINNGSTRAADMVHDACVDCHTAVGALDTSKDGTGYVLGTMALGNCGQCHTAGYFDSHVHGTDSGYISHVVTYVAGTDISQVSSPAPCENCHDGNNADGNGTELDSWTDILSEHETGCARCHSYTSDANNTPPQADNDNSIGSRIAATCTTCHTPKLSPAGSSDHGGHSGAPNDGAVDNNANCTTSCHGGGTADPIGTIHNVSAGQCDLCHNLAAGGGGLKYSMTAGDCTNCHFATGTAANHHTYDYHGAGPPPGRAKNGECVFCHMPNVNQPAGQPVAARGNISMPANLPCNWCHVYWYASNDSPGPGYRTVGGKVRMNAILWTPNTDSRNYAGIEEIGTGATASMPSHTISENTTTPVSDYAACFACHGASAATDGGGKQVVPWHGLGTVVAPGSTNDDDASNNDGGDVDDIINFYSGVVQTGAGQSAHSDAFHPGWPFKMFSASNTVAWGSKANAGYANQGKQAGQFDKIHDTDKGQDRQNGVCYDAAWLFDVPWDSYGTGTGVSTPVSTTLNSGGASGSFSFNMTMPLVPLSLPDPSCQ
jgi:hypothetical protein